MKKLLRTLMLAVLFLPFALQAQTECSSLSIPYAENFDAYTGNATATTAPTGYPAITLPDCWTFLNMSESTSTYPQAFLTSSSTYAVSGNCLFFKSSSTTPLYAIMPSVGDQTGAWQLSFQYRNEGTTASNGTIIVGTMTDVTDASTFVTLQILERTTTKTLMEIIIPAGTVTNGARLAFCYEGGTSNNYYASIDNVTLDVAPTCVKVTSLAIDETLTSPNSLTMTWTDALNIGATYSVYDMSDTTFITGGINDYTYTVTGLAANTAYTFGIQTDCGGGDIADGYVTVSGRTACEAMALPWTCGFEADEIMSTTQATALPWCSSRLASTVSNPNYPYSYSSTTYSHTGSRALYYYGTTSTTYPDTMGYILPEIDVTTYPMNDNRVTFWARMGSASNDKNVYVYTMTDPTDVTTMTLIDSVLVSGTTHVKYAVPLTNAAATDAYVVLAVMRGSGSIYLDDLTLELTPSCPDITGLAVTAVTSSTMTLSWNSAEGVNGYTIYDADDEFIATTTETTYTIENLDANTLYTFGVQSNCSTGDGSVSTASGRTECAAFAAPHTWDFEDQTSGTPNCWTKVGNGTAAVTNSSTNAHAGSYYLKFSGSTSNLILLPETQDEISTLQVRFWTRPESFTSTSCGTFSVGYVTDATNDSSFVEMANYAYSDFSAYAEKAVTFAGAPTGARMAMRHNANATNWYWYVDDVTIEEAPACLPVSVLTASNVTSSSATISWVSDASSFNVYDMSDSSLVASNVTTNTYDITGLNASTNYIYGVRAVCGSDESPFSTVNFTTECAPFAAPHTWDFEDQTSGTPNCWTKVGTGTAAVTNSTTSSHGGSYYLKFSGSTSNLILLPETQDEINTLQVRFWTRPESFTNTSCGSFSVGYVTDATNDSSFVEMANYAYSDFSAYAEKAVTFAGAPTGARMAMRHNANSTVWYWYVDDVTIEAAPDCLPVSALSASNVTAHEATLTWQGEASSYNVYDMSDTSFVATVNDLTYDITGLTSETSYTYGVSAICSSEESPITTVSFTTLISCPAPTALNATYNPNDPTEVTLGWTENGTATDWQIVLNGDETNIIDVNTNPYVLTNIIPDSIYTVKVRAYCDVDDQSAWSSSISIESSTKTVIGSGDATNSYLPTYCLYNYSLTQQIYTVAELGDAGLIESIDFYNNGTAERIRNLSVYIVSTPKDTFESATDWISVSAADLQFSGNVTFAPQAWTTISLNGFAYDGLNNIAIIVDDNTGSWESSMSFRVFDAPKQALRIYSDGTNYDVNAPSYSGTVMDVKNQIRLVKGDLSGCLKPSGVTVSYTGGDQAVVTWSSDATSFNIDVNGVVTNNVTSPYTLSGLSLATIYTVSLQAVCSPTSVSEWTNPINFTTDACMPVNQCTVSIYAQDSYGDGWNGNTIHIIQNGVTVASYSMASQNVSQTTIYDTFQVNVCSGVPVDFAWESGSYAYETSFQILNGSDSVVYSVADGSTLSDTVFLTLSDACAGSTPTESLTIHLTINNPALGTINPVPGTYVVALNDSLVLSATPAAGATFDGWKISVGTQTMGTIPINPFTIPVNPNNIAFGELNVVAMFSDSTSAPDSMTVIINTADATMGTTNPAPGTYNLAVGSQTFVTAIPNDGYQLLYWIESMTVGDMTVTDTLYADTIIVNVIPIMAGITSSLTACFEAIPVQPCAVPTGLTATAIHNESIELAWDNADVEGWNIQWRVGTGTWASAHTTTNNYTITGLTGLTTYEIQVQADCGDGNLSDWSNSITATTTNVGIENFTDLKVTLFPNPAREYVDIRIDGNANVTAMEVFDVYGKLINTVNVIDNLTRINVNGLADGMYFVRVTTDNGTVTKTFVKK